MQPISERQRLLNYIDKHRCIEVEFFEDLAALYKRLVEQWQFEVFDEFVKYEIRTNCISWVISEYPHVPADVVMKSLNMLELTYATKDL